MSKIQIILLTNIKLIHIRMVIKYINMVKYTGYKQVAKMLSLMAKMLSLMAKMLSLLDIIYT